MLSPSIANIGKSIPFIYIKIESFSFLYVEPYFTTANNDPEGQNAEEP